MLVVSRFGKWGRVGDAVTGRKSGLTTRTRTTLQTFLAILSQLHHRYRRGSLIVVLASSSTPRSTPSSSPHPCQPQDPGRMVETLVRSQLLEGLVDSLGPQALSKDMVQSRVTLRREASTTRYPTTSTVDPNSRQFRGFNVLRNHQLMAR